MTFIYCIKIHIGCNIILMDKFSLHNFLPYQLNVMAKKTSISLSHIYADYGLDRAGWRIMTHLVEKNESVHSKVIRESATLDKAPFSRAVFQLEKRGLIKRTVDKKDRRNHTLKITPKGTELYNELIPLVRQWEQEFKEKVGKDNAKQLLKLLKEMAEK